VSVPPGCRDEPTSQIVLLVENWFSKKKVRLENSSPTYLLKFQVYVNLLGPGLQNAKQNSMEIACSRGRSEIG
jgi:hypothetical protein